MLLASTSLSLSWSAGLQAGVSRCKFQVLSYFYGLLRRPRLPTLTGRPFNVIDRMARCTPGWGRNGPLSSMFATRSSTAAASRRSCAPVPGSNLKELARAGQCFEASCSNGLGPGITTGDRFLQLGDWRFADIDGNHFSISHRRGQTAMIYRNDGTRHGGPRTDWGSWGRESKNVDTSGTSLTQQSKRPIWKGFRFKKHIMSRISAEQKIKFGDRFIQFGNFRMGAFDDTHFSISHRDGQTIQVFRSDGTLHPGPRTDYGLWHRPIGVAQGVTFGDRFVQMGNFRVGDVDSTHFSVSHIGSQTIQIYRSDGEVFPGPRTDWTTLGRQLLDCRVE